MDENLVGYLLGALDPDLHRQVEDHLQAHPETHRRLNALRRMLEPLSADGDEGAPLGLADRTIAACTAETQPVSVPLSARLPLAPRPRLAQRYGHSIAWFRRGDAVVAAGILIVCLGVGIPIVASVARDYQVYACQNNLRKFNTALVSYSDNHGGEFPRVEALPPRNVAGIFVPILKDSGVLGAEVSVACPARGKRRPASCGTLTELEAMQRERPDEFSDAVRDLCCCYAYSLGYGMQDGQGNAIHCGLRREEGSDRLPILADRPAYDGNQVKPGNSPNHGGRGQNVLHVDGHVEFVTKRTVGINGDDIYVNRDNRAAAGRDRTDTVLGASWICPYPQPNE
jgi:prepilin-type processing-associated H-X9-DG protein